MGQRDPWGGCSAVGGWGDVLTGLQVAVAVGCPGLCRELRPDALQFLGCRSGVGRPRSESAGFDDGDLHPEVSHLTPEWGWGHRCHCPRMGPSAASPEMALLQPFPSLHNLSTAQSPTHMDTFHNPPLHRSAPFPSIGTGLAGGRGREGMAKAGQRQSSAAPLLPNPERDTAGLCCT